MSGTNIVDKEKKRKDTFHAKCTFPWCGWFVERL
jgi:hypothetical protein